MPPVTIAGLDISSFEDLSKSPAPTVGLRIKCGDGVRIIVRPSGTEPKLKTYIEVIGEVKFADTLVEKIKEDFKKLFASYS
jgi:phosphomannomutase